MRSAPEHLDALSSRLIELGSSGMFFPSDREDEVWGYLPDDDGLGNVLDEIRHYLDSLKHLGFRIGGITARGAPEVDWVRDFQEKCVPRTIGPYQIVPAFQQADIE